MLVENTVPRLEPPQPRDTTRAKTRATSKRLAWLHRAVLFTHRWAGVILGLPILILAVTGAMLVFEDSLDRAVNANLLVVAPQQARAPVQAMADLVRATYPNDTLFELRFHADVDRSAVAYLRLRDGGYLVVFLDQYRGTIKGHRSNLDTPMMLIHRLHTGRIAGAVGQLAAGVLTVVTLVGVLGGLYLWWPRKTWSVKKGVGWRRQNFDLHSVLGIFSSIVLVVTLLTGIVIAWDAPIERWLVRWIDGRELPPRVRAESTPRPGLRALTLDQALAVADATLPGTTVVGINVPATEKATYSIGRRFPEDKTGAGRSGVVIDQFSGKVLRVINSRTLPIGTQIMNFNETTHVGTVLGWPTVVLAFLGTVALAGQVVTGFLIWWRPRRRRTPTPSVAQS